MEEGEKKTQLQLGVVVKFNKPIKTDKYLLAKNGRKRLLVTILDADVQQKAGTGNIVLCELSYFRRRALLRKSSVDVVRGMEQEPKNSAIVHSRKGKTNIHLHQRFGNVISSVTACMLLRNASRDQQCLFFSLAGYVEGTLFSYLVLL